MIRRLALAALAAVALAATLSLASAQEAKPTPDAKPVETKTAIFAGGCFWCMEPPFDRTEGVLATTSGYIGGTTPKPTYEQVSSGRSGHTEAVQVTYDPAKVTYEKLLDVFWRNIDPLDAGGQFCDRGSQYRAGVFYLDEAQRKAALESKTALDDAKRFKTPILAEITAAGPFTAAEDYHQDFYKKNPGHYYRYRAGCGRDRRLEELWGKATH